MNNGRVKRKQVAVRGVPYLWPMVADSAFYDITLPWSGNLSAWGNMHDLSRCPHCGNSIDSSRIVKDRKTGNAIGYCNHCSNSSVIHLPVVHKKLIYLDQSFLSSVYRADGDANYQQLIKRIFTRLQELRTQNRVSLIISDIHCLETTGFPDSNKIEEVWKLQNSLTDGLITGDWLDIFVKQHRRVLAGDSSTEWPSSDLGVEGLHQYNIGTQIILNNKWRLQLYSQFKPARDEVTNHIYNVLEKQAVTLPSNPSMQDCVDCIHSIWNRELLQAIEAKRVCNNYMLAIQQVGNIPDAAQISSLEIPQYANIPLMGTVGQVIRGMNEAVALQNWAQLLQGNFIGPCPTLRIRAACEAVLLHRWCSGSRRITGKFDDKFGVSCQNDINHVAAFAPYVDSLTVDRKFFNLCTEPTVQDELKRFRCQFFSSRNYGDFETWLDNLPA